MIGSRPKTDVFLNEIGAPEIVDSELFEAEGFYQYQSIVGRLKWAVSLRYIRYFNACDDSVASDSCQGMGI